MERARERERKKEKLGRRQDVNKGRGNLERTAKSEWKEGLGTDSKES